MSNVNRTGPHNEGAPSGREGLRAKMVLHGRYTLIRRLAKGGMGEVWMARDTRTGTRVAAKVLRPELTGEEISLSRLRLEAQNAMRARHPNIASVLDSGESDGLGWIVMELVEGDPLTDFMGDGKRLTPAQLIPVLIQAAYALDGAAQAGIVHRDIKPANIMIRPDGLVKLTDFGISYAAGQVNLTAVGMVMGTAQYLAPEQAMGATATPSGDLYSLGIIAYEALAGHRPFTGKTVVEIAMAHVNDPIPPLPLDVPTELVDIVSHLLEKQPEDRPATGTALVRALNRAAEQIGVSTAPAALKQLKPRPNITGTRQAEPRPSARDFADKPGQRTPNTADASDGATPSSFTWRPVSHETTRNLPSEKYPRPGKREDAAAATKKGASKGLDWGFLIIVALIVLTVVLIIFAMIRDRSSETNALTATPTAFQVTINQEVEPWLMLTHAF